MSLFSKIFKYKADVEVSLITSSLEYIESTSDYINSYLVYPNLFTETYYYVPRTLDERQG